MATVWPLATYPVASSDDSRFSLARNPSVSSDQRVMPSNTKGSAGGAAAAGGMEFQAQVVAWLASQVVAEAPAPWELKPAVLEAVGAETSQPGRRRWCAHVQRRVCRRPGQAGAAGY